MQEAFAAAMPGYLGGAVAGYYAKLNGFLRQKVLFPNHLTFPTPKSLPKPSTLRFPNP